ncbi:hypothetical protein VNO78_10294 [Psophocarpus tetragonolobus]|uniref:Uncharacterized protein n=1 Tax=Psophocarpus tetragonolobus TaxID=3891 RepID=A0AAN9SJK8_PSOTE
MESVEYRERERERGEMGGGIISINLSVPLSLPVPGRRFLLNTRRWEWKPKPKPKRESERRRGMVCMQLPLPVDPWAPTIDSQSIASQLFAFSLFPYIGFLYFITKSKTAPNLTLFGFYFLLLFVAATIPAGIYAKVHYGTSLSNVDWLHGGAESLLTLTNLFIVLGLRQALRKHHNASTPNSDSPFRD